jgi:hypothetical protein
MGSLYGFEVQTELPLQRLNRTSGTRGTLTVKAAVGPLAEDRGEPVSTLVGDDGRRWYASHELNGRCLLELPPSGEFLLDPERGRVSVHARDDDPELLEHRVVSSALCTLLAMRGDLVLHASAVAFGERAVVFCGPSRRGKSTLVRVLGRLGHPVLGEDGIDVSLEGEPVAFPGARGVRVRGGENGAAAELMPDPGPEEPGPCPVGAVVLLGERRQALGVERLEPARALALLTPNLVHTGGRDSIAAAFARLAQLLHSVPAFRANLLDDLEALPGAALGLLDGVAGRS